MTTDPQQKTSKFRWGEMDEDDDLDFLLPPKQVIGPDENGLKTVIEYKFNEEGNKVKITTKSRVRKLASARLNKRAMERRSWPKFGDAANEDAGSRLTMVSTEEILLERPRAPGTKADDTKAAGDNLSQLGKGGAVLMVCRTCGKKGDHWTSKCPYKDLAAPTDVFVDKPPTGETSTASAAPGSGKAAYVPPSMRAGADRSSGGSDMRRRNDENSVRDQMASSDELPGPYPARDGGDIPPGDPTTMKTMMIDKGAAMLQSLKPIKQMSLHMCSFACYGHDPSRQIEVHFYVHRVNEDFLQCAVYDCDSAKTHLIGIEYIVSERLFESLSSEEQKLWHSHDYEIQTGLLMTPRVPELVAKPELQNIAKTYGKFWCTWQTDRGDKLPLGAPALMMSPQDVNMGKIKPGLLKKRDDEYGISTESLKTSRAEIVGLERKNPMADYWVHHGKGFAVDIIETDMKKCAPFP